MREPCKNPCYGANAGIGHKQTKRTYHTEQYIFLLLTNSNMVAPTLYLLNSTVKDSCDVGSTSTMIDTVNFPTNI